MDVIHRKNGKLHIYVRQDKYKGELKSHNWVGRTYIDGKQKIISSKTTDLEKATVILEKWFDDLHLNKSQSNDTPKIENNIPEEKVKNKISDSNQSDNMSLPTKSNKQKTPIADLKKMTKQNKFKNFFNNYFKSKVGKMSVATEEVVGVDITPEAIRVAQVSKDKNDKWILDKYSYRMLDKEKVGDNLLDSKDYLSEEIPLVLANAKITTKNVAISIPVTSAVIKVVTSVLMNDEEMKVAIETGTLWKNLVQMEDINDYSVFHQIIERNSKKNEMEILFVASKLSDVNAYSSLVKKGGLNPVIMDVRCFSLKNAFDNTQLHIDYAKQTAILEFGLNENYLMIIYNNMPIVKDIFLKPQEKQMLVQARETQQNNSEVENVIRRFCMQIKQILNEHESKYQTKINAINVVSGLKNIKYFIPQFMKNLQNTGFKIFDPLALVSIPTYNRDKINIDDNKSTIASVMGLAYRKLDIFGYYKFVTAVRNINLLPNRDTVRQQNKIKFLSGFAFKGLVAVIVAIYFVLIGFSLTQYYFNKEKLLAFDKIQAENNKVKERIQPLQSKLDEMNTSMNISKNLNSNQGQSFRSLAQVARSVPSGVIPQKIEYDGENQILIEGLAIGNNNVTDFSQNLRNKSLIKAVKINGTYANTSEQTQSTSMKKSFNITVTLDFSESGKGT